MSTLLRTFNFDQMAPKPGASGSVNFTLPNALPNGSYNVQVSASGVASSNMVPLTISVMHVTGLSGTDTQSPGGSVTWTVTVSSFVGGTINLSSSDTSVATVPSSIVIPNHATTGTFSVTSQGCGSALISASVSGGDPSFKAATKRFGWRVNTLWPAATVPFDLSLDQDTANWTVVISNTAPASGITVNLQSNDTRYATVPASVVVPAGSNSATFAVSRAGWIGGPAQLTASLSNSSVSDAVGTFNTTFLPVNSLLMGL